MFDAANELLKSVARRLCELGGVILFAVAFLICIDVIFRNLGRPLIGSLEIVQILFLIACFFGFAHTHFADREIRVDLARLSFHGRLSHAIEFVAAAFTCALFGVLTYFAARRGVHAWLTGDFLEGRLLVPSVIPWSAIAVGSALMTLSSLSSSLRYLAGLVRG